ncbi:hypothetical protein HC031_10005 [Planosporangium thailandense]|uniref:Tyr recombinase domain-containing protein n=1 Tax=Planosporangium thailandense TaxID=765197 RepID=A0ABX0XY03_9ACTN|nr:hypothetical protein [Planosporangium thailandense]NJC70039.1 hypothetical protein [Planosporangium thailandense]
MELAAESGLRAGELAGLRVGNLDTVGRRVTVETTAREIRGEIVLGTPKTNSITCTILAWRTMARVVGSVRRNSNADSNRVPQPGDEQATPVGGARS